MDLIIKIFLDAKLVYTVRKFKKSSLVNFRGNKKESQEKEINRKKVKTKKKKLINLFQKI
ncbi:hypothetical protein TTHERM_01044660 (macronuclear) [Tetrahymena thermophila SB210]|uniref:Uncharacterized protein n=1 Tax=Tetrahymena thermophila (strain SB210) TaxID=312017 RepID=Q22CF3_TETTS|nr:hypothetical protein TTHERM_01044660 [Tetrahymena thermophila SB210]EAR82976.1 hypothetical protein TTHERM_01044660 [Tetrahymena thermophila SB210]|eukprot:XP_001030639.1 hypothetical protein TTHERM_01044660 [Tetrahymena thermophila SB210]